MGVDYSLHTILALWSLAVGAFLCVVYDLFRITRLRHKQNAVVLFISDFVYCIIAAITMTVLFFNLSYGRMRAYAFAFAIIGFLVWRVTVSRLAITLLNKLIDRIEKLLNSIIMRVSVVITRIARRIYTSVYCNTAVKSASNGCSLLIKRKENENETDEKNQN